MPRVGGAADLPIEGWQQVFVLWVVCTNSSTQHKIHNMDRKKPSIQNNLCTIQKNSSQLFFSQSPCWSGSIQGPYIEQPKNTNNAAPSTPPVNSDITIVFPTPELVYTDIYKVGVPYFLAEILFVEVRTSCHHKKTHDPNSTISLVCSSPPTLPPDAPPLAPLVANTYGTNNTMSAMSNSSNRPNGVHHFIVIAFLAQIVINTMCNSSNINCNN